MCIINMASSKEEAEKLGGINIRQNTAYGTDNLWLYDTHIGVCIHDREHNGYDDSDFYMLVWNEEKQYAEEICFASTRGWAYPCYASKPDATKEVMDKYNAWKIARNKAKEDSIKDKELHTPNVGKMVKIIGGRKYKNLIGKVFYVGKNKFGYSNRNNLVIGVESDSKKFFVPIEYGEVICY
jgi:hypothetical protein